MRKFSDDFWITFIVLCAIVGTIWLITDYRHRRKPSPQDTCTHLLQTIETTVPYEQQDNRVKQRTFLSTCTKCGYQDKWTFTN